jgi:DNA-directed RNA polymerase specialized sigma24 family protein
MRAEGGGQDASPAIIFLRSRVRIGCSDAHGDLMLDILRADTSDEASTEAIARALADLRPADLLRLKRAAQLRARLIPGLDWEDLLNEALLRALDGSRQWPAEVPLVAFLAGIMRSLADARAKERRRLLERSLAESGGAATAPPDARLHARQCLKAIAAFFADDPDVLTLISALAERHLGPGGRSLRRLTEKRRDAARKRLARAILRGELDRFLP